MSGLLMGMVWNYHITGNERDVLLAMADHAHDDGSSCYPSVPRLAWKIGISERTIQRIIAKMVAGEVLELVGEASYHRPKEYRIDLSKLRAKAPLASARGDRGDKSGVTGVTNQGVRGDTMAVTLTIENHPIEPTTGAPAGEQAPKISATATPKRAARAATPWSAFRTLVLDDYGQASNKGTQALATRIIQTAEHHGLEPEDAARAWRRWRAATVADDTARYWPIHRASEGWGAWLQERRARAKPIALIGRVDDPADLEAVTT